MWKLLQHLNKLASEAKNESVRSSIAKLRDDVAKRRRAIQTEKTKKMIDKKTREITNLERVIKSGSLDNPKKSKAVQSLITKLELRALIFKTRDAIGDPERAVKDLRYALSFTDFILDSTVRKIIKKRLYTKIGELKSL